MTPKLPTVDHGYSWVIVASMSVCIYTYIYIYCIFIYVYNFNCAIHVTLEIYGIDHINNFF